jgi:hypothetical protein
MINMLSRIRQKQIWRLTIAVCLLMFLFPPYVYHVRTLGTPPNGYTWIGYLYPEDVEHFSRGIHFDRLAAQVGVTLCIAIIISIAVCKAHNTGDKRLKR